MHCHALGCAVSSGCVLHMPNILCFRWTGCLIWAIIQFFLKLCTAHLLPTDGDPLVPQLNLANTPGIKGGQHHLLA